jgi:hypothetical protein
LARAAVTAPGDAPEGSGRPAARHPVATGTLPLDVEICARAAPGRLLALAQVWLGG